MRKALESVTPKDRRKGPLLVDREPRFSPEELRKRYLAKKKLYSPIAVERKKAKQRALREARDKSKES